MAIEKPKGPPRIDIHGTSIVLPHPDEGGRKDRWLVEKEDAYKNLTGRQLIGVRKHRYTGDFRFSLVSWKNVENIKKMYNRKIQVQWWPWSDLLTLSMGCYIRKFIPEEGENYEHYHLVIRVEAVDLVDEVPETEVVHTGRFLYQSAGTA